MYAGDLVDVMWRVLHNFNNVPNLMNVGVGSDYLVNDYYRTAAEAIGWRGRFVHYTSKPAGMKQKLVSIELQKKWGWSAKTTIHDGIDATYDHYLRQASALCREIQSAYS